jgi:hypothetical protein
MIVKPNDPNVRGRLSCEEVDRALSEILRNCKENEEYASKAAPWSRSQMERTPTVQNAVEADLAKPAVEALLRKDLRIYTGPTQRIYVPTSPKVFMCHPIHPA